MPRLAAAHALKTGSIAPYHKWSWWDAKRLCWAHDVEVTYLFKLKPRIPPDLYQRLDSAPWEAQTITYADGGSVVVVKTQRLETRLTWTLVHELGHLLVGHLGAKLNLQTGEYIAAPKWHEEEADRFARNVLLPADEMRTFIDHRVPSCQIAERKGVSFSAVKVRLMTMHRDGEFDKWAGDGRVLSIG